MATAAAGGIPPPTTTGDGALAQTHQTGVSGPLLGVGAADQKPHFVAPTSNPRLVSGAGVPSSRPSPLFPPQASVTSGSLPPPPQAGSPMMQRFPPPLPPSSTTTSGSPINPPGFVRPLPPNGPPVTRPAPILPPPAPESQNPTIQVPSAAMRPPSLPPPGGPPLRVPVPLSRTPPLLFRPPSGLPPSHTHPSPRSAAPPNFPPPPPPPPQGLLPSVPRTHPLSSPAAALRPPEQGLIPSSSNAPPSPVTQPTQQPAPSPQNTSHSLSPQETSLLPASPQQQIGDDEGSEQGRSGKEVWFEHKMPDGRVYFSHSVSRKTMWDRPANSQITPHPSSQQSSSAPPSGPNPAVPNASHLVPTRVWSDFCTPDGKVYFYNKITRVSVWEKPTDIDLVMPLPMEIGAPPTNIPPPHHQQPGPLPRPGHPPPGPRPPLMSTPHVFPPPPPPPRGGLPFNPRFPPGPPGPPPPVNQQSPHLHNMEPRFPPPPPPLPHPTSLLGAPPMMTQRGGGGGGQEASGDQYDQENMEVQDEANPSTVEIAGDSIFTSSSDSGPATVDSEGGVGGGGGPPPAAAVAAAVSEPQESEKEEVKGPRPTASVPVPGTPWLVVWTSDERYFFFDVTSRVSLWIIPEELKDNSQVEKIIENGPTGKKAPPAKRIKLAEEEEENEEEMEEGGVGELNISVGGHAMARVQTVPQSSGEVADTEKKAVMLRSGKTPEERQEEFKGMLLERGVSAFSTWDKELPKFVFDPRYMLLNSRERKTCFEEYIRSRAEDERKEKRSKLKARRDDFRKLLEESKLHSKSSFSDFAQRHGKDEKFKGVEKMREREQLFSEYLQELKKTTVKGRQRSSSASTDSAGPTSTKGGEMRANFVEMLSENKHLTEDSQWRKVKGGMERDPRYRAVLGGTTQREEWFREYIKSLVIGSSSTSRTKVDPNREREERIQASLKEREREVQMSRSAQEKEWGRERDQLRKTEALHQFNAMLADNIRTTGVSWNEAKKQLRQDSRWTAITVLEPEEREKRYQEHCDGLMERKRLHFRRLLDETPQITLVMPWKKARKLIREDPRYKNFTESDHRREAEYDKHLRDKMVMAKNEFRCLLRETKIITYKSHKLIEESEKHYNEVVKVLENDQRYLVLECASEERERILGDYVADLDRRGPPPPPTASNPSERLRKT